MSHHLLCIFFKIKKNTAPCYPPILYMASLRTPTVFLFLNPFFDTHFVPCLVCYFELNVSFDLHILEQEKENSSNLLSVAVGIKQKDTVDKMVGRVRIRIVINSHLHPNVIRVHS